MTSVHAQPDWTEPAPPEANLAVINGMEYAAAGDPQGCCTVLADSAIHPGWLMVVAVDVLASLGSSDPELWRELRWQLHDRAVASEATDTELRASLMAVAIAEARSRQDSERVAELEQNTEASPFDLACVATQIAGQLASASLGERLADRLQAARKLLGGVP